MLSLAFVAGLLSTVNPCGFAMLPAFLGFYIGTPEELAERSLGARMWQGLGVGTVVSVGFAAIFTTVGLVVAVGLRSVIHVVPWAAAVTGLTLSGVGLA